MSVEKFNPIISGEPIPYFMANTYVVQNITNMAAGFVWIYLLTLPKDWQVMKSHIKKHFGIGDDKLKGIFSYLNKHKLIEYVRERDSLGKLMTIEIRVLNGSRYINEQEDDELFEKPEVPIGVKTSTGVKTHPVDNHTCGYPPPTKNIDKQIIQKEHNIYATKKIRSEKKPKKRSPVPIPEDFVYSDKHTELAASFGLDVKYLFTDFTDKAVMKGTEWICWNTAFMNWIRKANEFKRPDMIVVKNDTKPYHRPNEVRSTVPEWGPGHPSYDELNKYKRSGT